MNPNSQDKNSLVNVASSRRTVWFAGGGLALVTLAAYRNTLSAPFLFDDPSSVLTNPTIRQLWPPWTVFSPPPLVTVSGRPLVNFTFALNHAISGTAPWSYHVVNLAIHLLAGLVLFGLVRRTLQCPRLAACVGAQAAPLAFASAALWTLSPLQTEAVTYVVQRVESLMGLCYLLTLYAFARAVEGDSGGRPGSRRPQSTWLGVSVAACLLGMASKEVMVSAPLLVLLYDRAFVAGSFREAWNRRARYYGALGGTWLLLGWLLLGTHSRGGTAGFDTDVSVGSYALTQFRALVIYFKLSFWPHPLVFDYGTEVAKHAADVLLPALAVFAVAAGTAWALVHRPMLGFAGAWFFAILAPSSSIVPVATQTIAEHRMYLPLAAVIVTGVIAAYAWLGHRVIGASLIAAVLFAGLTWQRNQTYRDESALWADTVARRPANPRAHYNLAEILARSGRKLEAVSHYETALRLDPDYAEAYNNLGVALNELGRRDEAFGKFDRSVRIDPGNPVARYNLGDALAQRGRFPEAVVQLEAALQEKPDYVEALNNLGGVLLQLGRAADAIPRLEQTLRLNPDFAEAHSNLGLALLQTGRLPEAKHHFIQVVRIAPRDASAHSNLGYIALQQDRPQDAVTHYRVVVQERPGEAESHYNFGAACARMQQWAEAAAAFDQALQIRSDYPEARRQLLQMRARLDGR